MRSFDGEVACLNVLVDLRVQRGLLHSNSGQHRSRQEKMGHIAKSRCNAGTFEVCEKKGAFILYTSINMIVPPSKVLIFHFIKVLFTLFSMLIYVISTKFRHHNALESVVDHLHIVQRVHMCNIKLFTGGRVRGLSISLTPCLPKWFHLYTHRLRVADSVTIDFS